MKEIFKLETVNYSDDVTSSCYFDKILYSGKYRNRIFYLSLYGTYSQVQQAVANIIEHHRINIYRKTEDGKWETILTDYYMNNYNGDKWKITKKYYEIDDIIKKKFVNTTLYVTNNYVYQIENNFLDDASKIVQAKLKYPLPLPIIKKAVEEEAVAVEELTALGMDKKFIYFPRGISGLSLDNLGIASAEDNLSLQDFLAEKGNILKEKALKGLKPLFISKALDKTDETNKQKIKALARQPLPAQVNPSLAIAKGLEHKKGLFVVGEMGVGKTFLSIAVSQLIHAMKTVVLCPTHLVKKWEREIKMVIPNAQVYDLNGMTISEILELKGLKSDVPTFFVLGREQAKLHYQTKFCNYKVDANGAYIVCPKCGKKVYEVKKASSSKFLSKCDNCHEPLEYAANNGFRRYAKSLLLKKYFKFDLCIADEVHELKGGDTAQGQALANLTSASKKTLALTGTLMGGYASNLFYLLWRVSPQTMVKLKIPYDGLKTFVDRYGVIEKIDISESEHKASIGRKLRTTTKEKPGISPLLISEMLENSVFIKLTDISSELPPYKEEVVSVEMSDEQASIYNAFESSLMSHVRAALARGNKSLLGKMVQSLYALPDGARRGEVVYDSEQQPIAVAEGLNEYLLPKEQYLADIIQQEKAAGRKVLVLLEHTGTRDLMPDLKERIESLVPDVKVDLLYSTTTKKVEDREGWILEHENDVLITNPRLVQTGLDLYQYPTIIFFQTGYSIFTLRQASRRSWRIGQTEPVKVYYLSYSGSLQEKALKLIASKLETALAVEGDLSDKGLTALSEADNSILVELAKSLIEGEKATPDDVKDAWTKAVEKELISDTTMSKEHEIEQTETVATTTEVTTKVDDKSVATKFTVVSNVSISNGKATFKFSGISYMLQNGKIYDEFTKKVAGKYEWKQGKSDKYALCYIYNLKKRLYIGKQGNRFVALEIKKVG